MYEGNVAINVVIKIRNNFIKSKWSTQKMKEMTHNVVIKIRKYLD